MPDRLTSRENPPGPLTCTRDRTPRANPCMLTVNNPDLPPPAANATPENPASDTAPTASITTSHPSLTRTPTPLSKMDHPFTRITQPGQATPPTPMTPYATIDVPTDSREAGAALPLSAAASARVDSGGGTAALGQRTGEAGAGPG